MRKDLVMNKILAISLLAIASASGYYLGRKLVKANCDNNNDNMPFLKPSSYLSRLYQYRHLNKADCEREEVRLAAEVDRLVSDFYTTQPVANQKALINKIDSLIKQIIALGYSITPTRAQRAYIAAYTEAAIKDTYNCLDYLDNKSIRSMCHNHLDQVAIAASKVIATNVDEGIIPYEAGIIAPLFARILGSTSTQATLYTVCYIVSATEIRPGFGWRLLRDLYKLKYAIETRQTYASVILDNFLHSLAFDSSTKPGDFHELDDSFASQGYSEQPIEDDIFLPPEDIASPDDDIFLSDDEGCTDFDEVPDEDDWDFPDFEDATDDGFFDPDDDDEDPDDNTDFNNSSADADDSVFALDDDDRDYVNDPDDDNIFPGYSEIALGEDETAFEQALYEYDNTKPTPDDNKNGVDVGDVFPANDIPLTADELFADDDEKGYSKADDKPVDAVISYESLGYRFPDKDKNPSDDNITPPDNATALLDEIFSEEDSNASPNGHSETSDKANPFALDDDEPISAGYPEAVTDDEADPTSHDEAPKTTEPRTSLTDTFKGITLKEPSQAELDAILHEQARKAIKHDDSLEDAFKGFTLKEPDDEAEGTTE